MGTGNTVPFFYGDFMNIENKIGIVNCIVLSVLAVYGHSIGAITYHEFTLWELLAVSGGLFFFFS
jgi:hypothetical protein